MVKHNDTMPSSFDQRNLHPTNFIESSLKHSESTEYVTTSLNIVSDNISSNAVFLLIIVFWENTYSETIQAASIDQCLSYCFERIGHL